MVVVERNASFTGLGNRAVDLTAPVPNTSKIGVWRIAPDNRYNLVGIGTTRSRLRRPSRRRTTEAALLFGLRPHTA